VADNLPKELPELLRVPDFHLRAPSGAKPRRIGEESHVPCDRPFSCCVRQGLMQHSMDVPHRLDTQSASGTVLATGCQEIRVKGVEVLRGEALQRHSADGGHHVVDDVATVRLKGARPELGLFCWQPTFEEVLTERDPVGRAVITVVALFDEVDKKALSVSPGRASSVPTVP
jgi:hypothetical protein